MESQCVLNYFSFITTIVFVTSCRIIYIIYQRILSRLLLIIDHLSYLDIEERFRLLDKTSNIRYNNNPASSEEEYEKIDSLLKSVNSRMEFHCHSGLFSPAKDRQGSSKAAKQKLIVACCLVLVFVCLEVTIALVMVQRWVRYPKIANRMQYNLLSFLVCKMW